MPRHSKNNTARGHFTYAERQMLTDQWGSKRARLGRDSLRSYDACALCLHNAREPVSCSEGHLFCKECIYENLLGQKQEIARQEVRLATVEREEAEERERSRQEARSRVLAEFERSQVGLGGSVRGEDGRDQRAQGGKERQSQVTANQASEARGTKRKYSFSSLPARAEEIMREAEEAGMRQIEAEQREARRTKLPSFWLPSLTPSQTEGPIKDLKLTTLCRAGSQIGHALSIKSLIPVNFTRAPRATSSPGGESVASAPAESTADGLSPDKTVTTGTGTDGQAICPSCKKGFNNSTAIIVMRKCGHVVCKSCVERLVKPSKACVECDRPLKLEKDLVEFQREGTGFAAGGQAETKKTGIAFQG